MTITQPAAPCGPGRRARARHQDDHRLDRSGQRRADDLREDECEPARRRASTRSTNLWSGRRSSPCRSTVAPKNEFITTIAGARNVT
jgi:hypothetical protein